MLTFQLHTKTHEGEKCYKCELCPYASISARHLESHMLVHTDQKPFQCTMCDQAFRQKQLLKRHMNLYHDPSYIAPTPKEKSHECPSCNRQFRHKGNLIRHMALHDPESSAREHALALKIGRKKRIEMINGEPVEQDYYDDEDDEEEEDEDEEDDEEYDYVEAEDEAPIEQDEIHENILPGELMKQQETIMAVGEDGNTNYMVVEVINMEEEHEDQLQMQDKDETMDEMAELYLEEDPLESNKDEGDEKDMSNCFGFVVSILLFRCTYHVAQMHS